MQQGLHGNRPRDPAPLDPRWVELVLAGLVAGCAFIVLPRSILVPSLLVPALAVYAAALARRWSAGGRLGAFLLLLAVVGVAPTLATMDAYHTSFLPTYGHDGGVIVTGRATEELLAGHNPYTVSYAGSLRGSALLIDGTWTENPILDRYPYSPGTFLVQVPFTAAALALGHAPDTRWLYLLVYVAVAVGLARWSLRLRGDLLVPLFLPFLWQGETDVLLLAGLAGLAWALARDRPVVGALALGIALTVKLLLAPFGLVFLAWLAARAWRGGLERPTALRAAGALALPCAVTWAPFPLWGAAAMVQDVVLFHAGLAHRGTRSAAPGSRPCCSTSTSSATAGRPRRSGRPWSRPSPRCWPPAPGCGAAPGVADLLGTGAAASLAALYFSRAFTMTYWWLPAALLSLAALTRTGPRPPEAAAIPEAVPEKVSTPAR